MTNSVSTQAPRSQKIIDLLKNLTTFSITDSGFELANNGAVLECGKTGSKISGVVKDALTGNEGQTEQVSLSIISSRETEATCTCSSEEDMKEQWCKHAVALLSRADELGFLESNSGFAPMESAFRINTSSAQDIANVIEQISRPETRESLPVAHSPKVSILLDLSSDRLGVRVLFDNEAQAPAFFEGFRRRSSRALDNVILEVLENEGSWDEENQLWYVSSSKSIEVVLGLAEEYQSVCSLENKKKIVFAEDLLEAKLQIEWHDASCELCMLWCLPDGAEVIKDNDMIGTGPYWGSVKNSLYRVSPQAAKIGAIFPHSSKNTITRSNVGPILEALTQNLIDAKNVEVLNPNEQPQAQTKSPEIVLNLNAAESSPEHFDSGKKLQLSALIEFKYPSPPSNKNIVYLPDREREKECLEILSALGLEAQKERNYFIASGDVALDIASQGAKIFPKDWAITGFDILSKNIRFANLSLNVSLKNSDEKSTKKLDWFDCHISLVQNNANVPLSSLFKSTRSDTDRWLKLDTGAYAKIPGGNFGSLKTTLGLVDANYRLSNTIKSQLSVAQAIGLSRYDDELVKVSSDSTLKNITEKFQSFKGITPVKISKNFTGKLRKYQNEGLTWLNFLKDFQLGGILADEMGLGKTVQTLAFLQHLKDNHESSKKSKEKYLPVLVVAPTSVTTNWQYEVRRFTPKLKCLLLHGPKRKDSFSQIPEHDIVITSYALLRIDRQELEKYEFKYIILDEAQNIKNSQAATTKAAKAMRSHHRLALTGTPTENRPMELWSIMDFLMPGYLGTHDFFRSCVERPILEQGTGIDITRFLKSKTRPFILRRTKAEVEKDLPPKIESVLHVEMAPSQADLYAQILRDVRPKVLDQVNKKGVGGAAVSILAALLRLRQVCNHPNSIEALKQNAGFESGKFNLLKELLEEALVSGRKILLFSQFKEMLAIIRRWLEEQKANYLYLDGATKDRQSLIDKFNSDDSVRLFLISLKAGGTGLNLTAADTVIIYDPWWNPAVESQAVDRAHRIGQTKTVNVYRLVTENSIEQKIMELKAKKSKLVDALVNENGLSTVKLSKADLESLFELPE